MYIHNTTNPMTDSVPTGCCKAFASSDLYPQSEPEGAEMKAQTARRQTAKHNMGISNGTSQTLFAGFKPNFKA